MNPDDYQERKENFDQAEAEGGSGLNGDYYAIPGCEGLVQQLMHLLRFGEGLPVVQAGREAGKSSMAVELYSRLSECSWLTLVRCEHQQNIAELLDQITGDFGLQTGSGTGAGAGESLAVLRQFSTQLANNRELAVLILDDVHLLDDQGLGAVLSLLQGNNFPGYGLHLVFFAAPGLVERVDNMGLLDAPVYDFEIPHFSPSELSGFLKSRFPGAPSTLLNATSVQHIWGQSLGSPGIALHLFEQKMMDEQGDNDTGMAIFKSMPKGHLLALGVLIAVLVWAIFAREMGESDEDAPVRETPALAPQREQINERPMDTAVKNAPETPDQKSSPSQTTTEIGQPGLSETLRKSPDVNVEPETSGSAEKVVEAAPTNLPPANKTTTDKKEVPAQGPGKSEPVYLEPPPQLSTGNNNKKSPPTPSGMTADELFLMDQPPETYTLQIIAASRKDALVKYMSSQTNREDLHLYQALREGRAWFVVVTGIFASREEAQQAVAGLPEEQKKAGPWPRQLSDVQSEIAANRRK